VRFERLEPSRRRQFPYPKIDRDLRLVDLLLRWPTVQDARECYSDVAARYIKIAPLDKFRTAVPLAFMNVVKPLICVLLSIERRLLPLQLSRLSTLHLR